MGICTQRTPPHCSLRTSAFEARYSHGHRLNLYFRPISLQLKPGPEPHSDDSDVSITPVKRPWQGNTTLQSTSRKPLLLSKLILASAICSYLVTAFFTAFISKSRDRKTVITLAYVDTFAERGQAKGMPCSTILASS